MRRARQRCQSCLDKVDKKVYFKVNFFLCSADIFFRKAEVRT